MRVRRSGLRLATCALLALAGCGGGDDPKPPTAAEIQAAHERWRDRVDDVCFDVNRAVGKRGYPVGVDVIGRTVAEGVADVRAGIRKVVAVRLPPGGSRAPAAFVRELKGLDAELAALPGGGAELEPAALVRAADRIAPRLRRLEVQAGKAALTSCMTHTERELVPDAVRAPIFIQRLERHDVRHIQRLPVYDEPASTPAELAQRMAVLARALDRAAADASTFDPPHAAAKSTRVYKGALRRLLNVTRRFERFVRRGGATPALAGLRRHQRAFARAWRGASHASGRMRLRAGLEPAPPVDNIDAQRS
jgi:hypothetical protein